MRMLSENRIRFDQERNEALGDYQKKKDCTKLLRSLSAATDRAVMREASLHALPGGLTFVAVGGYGREEMYPYSDLDILVLVPDGLTEEERTPVSEFLISLWDLGLTVGGTQRTVAECLEAVSDITVCTAILESRFIGGNLDRYGELKSAFAEKLRPADFFKNKMLEMTQRHARAGDSPYALEPNIKENPGGLRDLQVFTWVARASGFGNKLSDFADRKLITVQEAAEIRKALLFLQHLRIGLHLTAKRHEDRMLFDLQTSLAERLGYETTAQTRASEALMKDYYLNAKRIIQLSLILLQRIAENFTGRNTALLRPLDGEFGLRGEEVELLKPGTFLRHPEAILKFFYMRATIPGISRPSTALLRELWHAMRTPGLSFEPTEESREIFLSILKLHEGVYRALRSMNNWGILGLVLPAWERIDGQMQHDLFHVYTVDQHTMQVIRGLRHLSYAEHAHEFPLLSQTMAELTGTWRLIVAALFHDIGKGQGGSHAEIGEAEVRKFCAEYGIGREDTEFIAFLVREHLRMSHVAQKEDISDPDVIGRFAKAMGTPERLKALYLLTVCDIRATGPKVWNDWKGQLLERLYKITLRVLGGEAAPTKSSVLEMRKSAALDIAEADGIRREDCEEIWTGLDLVYFLRHSPEDIAWHAEELLRWNGEFPLVRARLSPDRTGYQILVFTPDENGLFSRIVSALQRSSLSVMDARIHTTRDGRALDTFIVSDTGKRPEAEEVIEIVCRNLDTSIRMKKPLPTPKVGGLARRSKSFPIRPIVMIEPDASGSTYLLNIACSDRTGLLYAISSTLSSFGVAIQTARIATLGERVEDIFQISGSILKDSASCLKISSQLVDIIAPKK